MSLALFVVTFIPFGLAFIAVTLIILFKRLENGTRLWDPLYASLKRKLQRLCSKIGKLNPLRKREMMTVALEMQPPITPAAPTVPVAATAPVVPRRPGEPHVAFEQLPTAPRRNESPHVALEVPRPVAARVAPPMPPRDELLPFATLRVSGLHTMKSRTREWVAMTPEERVAKWVADLNAETDLEKGRMDVPL